MHAVNHWYIDCIQPLRTKSTCCIDHNPDAGLFLESTPGRCILRLPECGNDQCGCRAALHDGFLCNFRGQQPAIGVDICDDRHQVGANDGCQGGDECESRHQDPAALG